MDTRINELIAFLRNELEDTIVKNPHLDMSTLASKTSTAQAASNNWKFVWLLVQTWLDAGDITDRPKGHHLNYAPGKILNADDECRVQNILECLERETILKELASEGGYTMRDIAGQVSLSASLFIADNLTHILVKRLYDEGKIKEYPEGYIGR